MDVTWVGGPTEFDGINANYWRLSSVEKVSPPYVWSGSFKLSAVMDPPVFGYGWRTGQTATWDPGVNFMCMYPSNDRNVLIGIGRRSNPTGVGISAEMRDVRPEKPYGVRTGYVSRVRNNLDTDPADGRWHTFRVEVDSVAEYRLFVDDRLVADVVEKLPATIDAGPTSVGLRLDFCAVELGPMKLIATGHPTTPGRDAMTQPFDHSRFDWYPPGLGGPAQVSKSDGTTRAALAVPLRTFGVHYGGAGASWLDFGDTPAELRGIELNHARPQGKPNEYNSVSDSAAETWEYAGRFQAAHSAGNNATVWGHLVLYGLERLTETEASGLIRGIRRARAQCVTARYVTAHHDVLPHQLLPNASTSCPGPLWENKTWWNRIAAPLVPADFDIVTTKPPPPPPPPPSENLDMPRVCYIAKPPTERWGKPWLFVADTEVREANSFDLKLGIDIKDFDLIEPQYRVLQYDKLAARAA